MALLGRCLWGGTDGCLWSGCSHQLPWARPALQQLFFCGLVPSKVFVFFLGGKGNIPDAAEWERRLLQVLQPWEA